MNDSPNPNVLLVEGKTEQYSIPFFMDRYVKWGNKKEEWVVEIREQGGVEDLLKRGTFKATSKTSGLKALGLILDADDEFDSRRTKVRDLFRAVDSTFPDDMPREGLIHVRSDSLRLGAWIMPDNQSRGMFETFLGLHSQQSPLWDLARASCDVARPPSTRIRTSRSTSTKPTSTRSWPGSTRPAERCKRRSGTRF